MLSQNIHPCLSPAFSKFRTTNGDSEERTETCALYFGLFLFSDLYLPLDNLVDEDGDENQPLRVFFERR